MKRLVRPQTVLALIFGAALLVGLLAFSDVRRVADLMASFQPIYFLYFVLVMLVYELVRLAQWHFLLLSLGIQVPLRTQIFTYITGEVTKDLPVGNFVPNYLLQRSQGTDFGFASSATLLITLIEVAVSLAGIVIVGIGGWTWLRPVILVGCFVAALVIWTLYRWHHAPQPPPWMMRWGWMRMAMAELRQFARGEATLLHPHVLGIATGLGALYLLLGGTGLWLIAMGMNIPDVSWPQLIAVYCFSIAFAAIVPLPMDFGSVEVSGTGALVASGMAQSAAVSIMLLDRLLSVGATLAIALVAAVVLRGELRAALAHRPRVARRAWDEMSATSAVEARLPRPDPDETPRRRAMPIE
jgi:lipoprotein signal peptidase